MSAQAEATHDPRDGSIAGYGTYRLVEPVLRERDLHAIMALCERVGTYRMASAEMSSTEIGAGLPERFECFYDLARQRGNENDKPYDPTHVDWLDFERAFTCQFRETYADLAFVARDESRHPEADSLLYHEAFVAGARDLLDRPVIVPVAVLANLYVAGQWLGPHTDITEFRGVNRSTTPQWLLICMHHSRLFDEWRLPIATAVNFFNVCEGGEFRFYPDGPGGAPVTAPQRPNTALLMDTDSIYHEVRPIYDPEGLPAPLERGQVLRFGDDRKWRVGGSDGAVVGTYGWDEMRFSVSWKAYCFRDETERQTWSDRSNDLTIEFITGRLTEDLMDRGLLGSPNPDNVTLARAIVDAYYHAPPVEYH
ncbi:MAG: hypothetical protein OXC14_15365 [Rhodospirillaceae bacterium]|nr:hypothetical protein [Rhodospirillaceae bacterium]